MNRRLGDRSMVVALMYSGLAMTVLATIVAYLDRLTTDTLGDHIRAGYPGYSQGRIDAAATTYLLYLSVVGVLGVGSWLVSVRALEKGRWRARGTATAMFVLGTTVALTDLLIKDTSGDTGLPSFLAWVGVLPCLPGLLAVTLLWRNLDWSARR